MLDVFLTVDVEIWCDGWNDIDGQFPDAFRKHIYGATPLGDYGLPYQLDLLNQHGLSGVFFIEPLFALRFGTEPLAEIVGLVRESGQEVQLHLHTEWVNEASKPFFEGMNAKRQNLRDFSLKEQTLLITEGAKLLRQAGAGDFNAFRAGSFGFNTDTLRALAENGIPFDSSYNARRFGLESGVMPGVSVEEPIEFLGVYEYPMTIFKDGTGSLRNAQLTACSHREMEGLLWQALEAGRKSFVILSHGSELLNRSNDRPDKVVVKRFRKLCEFLDRNRDSFRLRGFKDLQPKIVDQQPAQLTSPISKTCARIMEQAYRMKYN